MLKKTTMIFRLRAPLSFLAISISLGTLAQTKKPATTAHPATTHPAGASKAAPAVALKNGKDSLSYAIGLSVANFYKQYHITDINGNLVLKAINDVTHQNKVLMDEQEASMCISRSVQMARSAEADPARKAGESFLAANKTKPGVVTLPSGLQYTVVKEGSGPKPTINDTVRVHYHGTLINGQVFDSSVDRGQPVELPVGRVIRGWTEALQLMPVGSKWKLFIPSNLAYGDQGAGAIPPGSTLIFDVELLDIVRH
jgi:FKBP-type peptidyl-prolyl cis-trans isomerase FklB